MLLDGYIRVSQVAGRKGERFISPDLQRSQIEQWTSAKGAVLGEVFEEMDESGGRADRPMLISAIERIERGQSEGLIVAKLDRFGRSVIDGLSAIARIEDAGGTFVSVQDGLDLSTPTGKLVLRVLFSIGEWELDRMRSNWEAARSKSIARGAYICGFVPIGYLRGDDGRLHPDPIAGPVLSEAFRMRSTGSSSREVADFLNDSGIKKARSPRPFDEREIWRLVRRRVYLGESRSGKYVNLKAHEPLVDMVTWQLAQYPQRKHNRIPALLLGVIRCGACGARMGAVRPTSKASETLVYRCKAESPGGCPAPASARADEIEPLVEELVMKLASEDRPAASGEVPSAQAERVAAGEKSLAAYRDNPRLQSTLGMSSFELGLERRQLLLERTMLELAREKRGLRRSRVDLDGLEARWPGLDLEQRGSIIADLLDCVLIERGRTPVLERARACRRGRGPILVRGEAFDPSTARPLRFREPRRWPERRIESALGDFLGTRTEWPQYQEFAAAGRGRLHAQVMRWGGPYFWARRLGLKIASGSVRWNETRVNDALRPFLKGRKRWPERAEFDRAGLISLRRAIQHQGGLGHWAECFGLQPPAGRRCSWDKVRVEEELRQFIGDRETFPTVAEFRAGGRPGLHEAVRRNGGLTYWTKRLGLVERS